MPVCPHLDKSIKKKLHAINPHFEIRWNGHYEKWDIWHKDLYGIPYIVLRTSIIDSRTYQQLRYAMWISNHIKYHLNKSDAKYEELKEKKLKDEEDKFNEMGKEVAPLLRSLHNAGKSSHGRSVTMFPGIGTGIKI